ncbi:tyrosine-type recombinase/integrase [Corynebacterium ulcerans]|uniref:tyrosine-type recombinase/integrase n=1 Tax=Corynebacterium ulcerans TaxID=65058 RepID=UPI000C76996F|nr:site-specific integrase [Corynebacterium ulcerans]PLW02077.1 integrase [Corynebacterium ulcerans]
MSEFGSIRELPSGKFQARYRYRGQDYRAPHTFRAKGHAAAWLTEEEKLITFGIWVPPTERKTPSEDTEKTSTPVGEWITSYNDGLVKALVPIKISTYQDYQKITSNRITNPTPPGDENPRITKLSKTPLHALTRTIVDEWWDAINKTYRTPITNQKAYKRLKAAMQAAVDRELIPANPVDIKAAGARIKPEEKYLPEDSELEAILEHMIPRYKALTSLILFHGLRIGEAIALEQKHVTVLGEVPYAPRVVVKVEQNAQRIGEKGKPTYLLWQTPKTAAGYRDVPILRSHTEYFFAHLNDFLSHQECEVKVLERGKQVVRKKFLFTTTDKGKPVFDTSYRSVLSRAKKAAGVPASIDPHCGRNWLITRLAEQGAHLKEIGRLLGQDDISTILGVYMKVRSSRIDVLMDRVDASFE